MTSLTPETQMTLDGTVQPPSFVVSVSWFGGCMAALNYVWWDRRIVGGPALPAPGSSRLPPWGVGVLAMYLVTACVAVGSHVLRFVHGLPTSDPSVTDRLWSIVPVLYCWLFVLAAEEPHPRAVLMAVLASAWGARLTWNFWRKGGFSGGEDYRWKIVRSWFGPGLKYEVFNIVFICGYSHSILLGQTAPAAVAAVSQTPLGILDAVAATVFAGLLLLEHVADIQQFDFQKEKYRRKSAGEPAGHFERGFIETGVWAYSRHPNYFAEVALWWAFYLFAVAATGQWLHWSVGGAAMVTLLFVPPGASLDVTEAISSRKYPAYSEYQQRVSRFVPWWPRARVKSE